MITLSNHNVRTWCWLSLWSSQGQQALLKHNLMHAHASSAHLVLRRPLLDRCKLFMGHGRQPFPHLILPSTHTDLSSASLNTNTTEWCYFRRNHRQACRGTHPPSRDKIVLHAIRKKVRELYQELRVREQFLQQVEQRIKENLQIGSQPTSVKHTTSHQRPWSVRGRQVEAIPVKVPS